MTAASTSTGTLCSVANRTGRRGSGVAVYVSCRLSADIWACPGDSTQFELLWVRLQLHGCYVFVGGPYRQPKPIYSTPALHDCIEASVDMLAAAFPTATVTLAGDFNSLDDAEVATRSALNPIVNRLTRGANTLNRSARTGFTSTTAATMTLRLSSHRQFEVTTRQSSRTTTRALQIQDGGRPPC